MEVLRSDIEFLVALARADTRSHLVHWYSELGFEQAEQAWTHDPERTGPIGPLATGVEWSWVGVHDDEVSGAGRVTPHYVRRVPAQPPSGTVTFLFSDIANSTRLWEESPAEMASAVREHDVIVRGAIERHGGYVFAGQPLGPLGVRGRIARGPCVGSRPPR
jgi:hypothetical protein